VNERLGKEIFDCGTIADKYHCGCAGEDEEDGKEAKSESKDAVTNEVKKVKTKIEGDGLKGSRVGHSKNGEEEEEMKLEKEGLTRGG